MSFFRKAKKAASNAPRVTDKAEQPSGEQQSRVVQQNKAAETSSSSPTGVADDPGEEAERHDDRQRKSLAQAVDDSAAPCRFAFDTQTSSRSTSVRWPTPVRASACLCPARAMSSCFCVAQ